MSVEARLMTAAEFEAFVTLPENAEHALELIHGEIVEKMPTEEHSVIVGNIYFHLRAFVEANGLGRVTFEVRRQPPGDDHNVRVPDVDFTSVSRLNERDDLVKRGPVHQMPDLAVEVQSPGQSDKLMTDKADFYLTNGVQVVWLVYPRKALVEVLTRDSRILLSGGEILDGGDLLPGFSLRIEDIFKA